jgi:hypothetical protein
MARTALNILFGLWRFVEVLHEVVKKLLIF